MATDRSLMQRFIELQQWEYPSPFAPVAIGQSFVLELPG
jgi:hypothetical protein